MKTFINIGGNTSPNYKNNTDKYVNFNQLNKVAKELGVETSEKGFIKQGDSIWDGNKENSYSAEVSSDSISKENIENMATGLKQDGIGITLRDFEGNEESEFNKLSNNTGINTWTNKTLYELTPSKGTFSDDEINQTNKFVSQTEDSWTVSSPSKIEIYTTDKFPSHDLTEMTDNFKNDVNINQSQVITGYVSGNPDSKFELKTVNATTNIPPKVNYGQVNSSSGLGKGWWASSENPHVAGSVQK